MRMISQSNLRIQDSGVLRCLKKKIKLLDIFSRILSFQFQDVSRITFSTLQVFWDGELLAPIFFPFEEPFLWCTWPLLVSHQRFVLFFFVFVFCNV